MLFQQQPSQATVRALNDIGLDYQALYLDAQKERDYYRAKARPDWETAWHVNVARYPSQGQPIYAAIIRYCPEAALVLVPHWPQPVEALQPQLRRLLGVC